MHPEIKAYIDTFSPAIQARLLRVREILLSEVPGATEAIKYRMPTLVWQGNLIHYAGYERHIGIYPLPEVLESLAQELAAYKTGKGSVQLPNDQPLPEDLLRRIVRLRLAQRRSELGLA